MTTQLIINAVLSLVILAALFGVFGVAWAKLHKADAPAAVHTRTPEESLPYAA
jgi:hypothetical protein